MIINNYTMKEVVLQRIASVLSDKKMSITALSKLIGVPQPTLNRQISGESAMTLDILYSILNYFTDVSAEWLLRGEGEMIKGDKSAKEKFASKEFVVYVDENGFLKMK